MQGFLIASALYWLEHFHIDGLRVDAVASMLYRDYSRREGEWVPNVHGGRENLEAIGFLRHLNAVVAERCPGAIMVAEESTAWPGVSRPISSGGLGFSYKWNMGWMHDTLNYMTKDPVHRQYHHNDMTFGLLYAFTENFILPLSHDEVVYGKGSLIGKMPGDRWQRFANLRAYLGFMWGASRQEAVVHGRRVRPGTGVESRPRARLAFARRAPACRRPARSCATSTASTRRSRRCMSATAEADGFQWTIGDDRANSVFSFVRYAADRPPILVVCNMTPVPRHHYRVGVPLAGAWREIFNSDFGFYGGSNVGNAGRVDAAALAAHGQAQSSSSILPPLATIYLRHDGLIDDAAFPAQLDRGSPYPLGATWDGLGTNFAVFSAHAERIQLCLFDPGGRREIASSGSAGMHRRNLARLSAQCAHRPDLRLSRPRALSSRRKATASTRISFCSILMRDRSAGTLRWSDALFGYRINSPRADLSFDRRDSAQGMLKAVVTDDTFDWGDDRPPNVPWSKTVIYETHVRGMTMLRHDIRAQRTRHIRRAGRSETSSNTCDRSASPPSN